MNPLRRSRAGQLVIFDALLFLAVTSVASVGLIAALHQTAHQEPACDAQNFVESAHQALLGTTLSRAEGALGVEVPSLVLGILQRAGSPDPEALLLKVEVGAILGHLLQPRFGYVLTAKVGDQTLVVGCSGQPSRQGTDLCVSTVEVHVGGSDACFVLKAWPS